MAAGKQYESIHGEAITESKTTKFSGRVFINTQKSPRHNNEDSAFAATGNFHIKSDESVEAFLKSAFQKIDEKTKYYQSTGSTASAAVITTDGRLHIAHLGDSPVFLCRVEKSGHVRVKSMFDINSHKPWNDKERKRIEEAGGFIISGRVGGLNMSRAFGDAAIKGSQEQQLISKEPDIYHHDLNGEFKNEGDRLFIIVGSDGITDYSNQPSPFDSAKEVIRLIIKQAVKEKKEDRIAYAMVDNAYYVGGSGDDRTVLVMEIPRSMDKDVVLAVADGHGREKGREVADIVTGCFDGLLKHRYVDTKPLESEDISLNEDRIEEGWEIMPAPGELEDSSVDKGKCIAYDLNLT